MTNPYGWLKFGHTLVSGYVLAAFFVMGISAWHLGRKSNMDFFTRSFKAAAVFGLVTSLLVAVIGDSHTVMVAKTQPSKFAAMESVWESGKGVGMSLLTIPDEQNEKNAVELFTIPKLTSFLAFHDPDAQITGLKDIDKDLRPPVALTFYSFRIMVAFGLMMILAALAAVILSMIRKTDMPRAFLFFMICMIPVPYIAGQLGWITAEVGRQPWIVYGMLKTSDAVSRSIDTSQVIASLAGFTLLYGGLGIIDIYLLAKNARKGPDGSTSGLIKQPVKEN